jgi:hypothetical protein
MVRFSQKQNIHAVMEEATTCLLIERPMRPVRDWSWVKTSFLDEASSVIDGALFNHAQGGDGAVWNLSPGIEREHKAKASGSFAIGKNSSSNLIADLRFPCSIMNALLMSWSAFSMGVRGEMDPSERTLLAFDYRGWCLKTCSNIQDGLNSLPNDTGDPDWDVITLFIWKSC